MQSVHVKHIATYICTLSNRTAANLAVPMKLYVNIRRTGLTPKMVNIATCAQELKPSSGANMSEG